MPTAATTRGRRSHGRSRRAPRNPPCRPRRPRGPAHLHRHALPAARSDPRRPAPPGADGRHLRLESGQLPGLGVRGGARHGPASAARRGHPFGAEARSSAGAGPGGSVADPHARRRPPSARPLRAGAGRRLRLWRSGLSPGEPVGRVDPGHALPRGAEPDRGGAGARLGSVFTTYHKPAEARVREILGIPPEVEIAVTIPLGFPARGFRPARRRPLDEVLHRDRW